MTFFQYLKTKGSWKIMGYVALGYLGFILLSWFLLSWYTNHGEFVSIPEVKGKSVEEAIEILEDLDLEPVVIDSIWSDTAAKGSINYIMPPAGSTIKDGRQVYLMQPSLSYTNGNHQHQNGRVCSSGDGQIEKQGNRL